MPAYHNAATVLFAATLSACASPHLVAGQKYAAAGNLPLAIEVFDAGVVASPGNQELKDTLILTQQSYQYDLRRRVDRLTESGRPLVAMRPLILLEENARRAEATQMPTETPADLERERRGLVNAAVAKLEKSLDERAGRGGAVTADLSTCRQLQALVVNDEGIARTCERLLRRFKLVAILTADPGTHPQTNSLYAPIRSTLTARNPELIPLTDASAGDHNAQMTLYVGVPVVHDQPFLLTEHDAFHKWIQKRDRKGRPIEETVIIQPTSKQIADAKKNKKKPPKAKKKKKRVYEEVRGEYRVYRAERRVEIPYQVVITDLRGGAIRAAFGATATAHSESSYYDYLGDPRGQHGKAPAPVRGRSKAAALLPLPTLIERALASVPTQVVNTTLERVE